ncbi:uncharacterized protein BDZ99DRAFT_413104 [Mytilinidion resinicola]|uniref:Up-regulated during septation protein 1 domain-containing protein n=1 Tax=Mytilinidion resinicola TaxID=574789 RepID=A0A6A6YVK3_9PEZI|nr:uncharacterized protein BDZ99DRAFT_413104 [Mytilinidion resinicola]KAF2812403.1 hypothetical protein BDZ99DRAFT_413104 [Mytilinidion resinicola]
MQSNGLRNAYAPNGDGLSPQPPYDYPSPTSNYPAYMGGTNPAYEDSAYQGTPHYASNTFVPPPDVFLEGQRKPITSNMPDSTRGSQERSSTILKRDPVAMHLLVETAIIDSQGFEILSFEEVEALKREQQTINTRIDAVQRKLALESKVRDAAQSLNRLHSKKGRDQEREAAKSHRRSFGSRSSTGSGNSETLAKSEDEFAASLKKCDDLGRELHQLETRSRQVETQLLRHTAGILQITHEGPSKRSQDRNSALPGGENGRPDSPASIYTYENGRSNRAKDDGNFDERSLYRSPENLDGLMQALKNGTHHMPLADHDAIERQSQALNSVEKRLEDFNDRLRDLIVSANPERNQGYSPAPKSAPNSQDSQRGSLVEQHLDFLDQALHDVGAEHNQLHQQARHSQNATEGRLEGINNQLYALISSAQGEDDANYPPPPAISGHSSQDQINYMEEAFYNIEQLHYNMSEDLNEFRSKSTDQHSQSSQYEATLTGLWSIILAGEEEARQKKYQRRQLLAANHDAEDDVSPDEEGNANEEFSLPAFSNKVQWLYNRATTLKEKEAILRRQIKQQRELNSKSDEQKEHDFARLNDEINQARAQQAKAESELSRAIDHLEHINSQESHRNAADSEALVAEQAARHQAEDRYHELESQIGELQDDARIEAAELRAELAEASASVESLSVSLRSATAEKEAAEAHASEAANAVASKEQELRELEGEVIRLQTEVTIARAELDGAYGTRAQRAAEVAANPTIKKELDELGASNAALIAELESLRRAHDAAAQSETEARETERNLKQELGAMASEYEALTKDMIQNEKDRDRFEAMIDSLRDEKESLEMELSDERVRWLGVRSPGAPMAQPGAAPEATSIRMLREDFRKMMRDRTAEGLKALRAEQEERRKLEALVRTLRREQAPQKSSLSKTMTA